MAQRMFCVFYSPVSMAATQSTVFDVFAKCSGTFWVTVHEAQLLRVLKFGAAKAPFRAVARSCTISGPLRLGQIEADGGVDHEIATLGRSTYTAP
jgi:hypothetical protein